MAKNKLSLVRETILPLSSDELSNVAGGQAIGDLMRSKNQGSIAGTLTEVSQTCFPRPRPTSGITSGPRTGDPFTGGTSIRGGQVSGVSNAF